MYFPCSYFYFIYAIAEIQLVIRRVQRLRSTRGLVVLVTYEGMRTLRDALCAIEWTAVCLDEGHRVRNPNAEVSIEY